MYKLSEFFVIAQIFLIETLRALVVDLLAKIMLGCHEN
jgi:hypothetical protein